MTTNFCELMKSWNGFSIESHLHIWFKQEVTTSLEPTWLLAADKHKPKDHDSKI